MCRFETTTLLKNRWWGHLRFSISCDCLACNSSWGMEVARICDSFPTRRHQWHINRTFSWITQHVWCCWGWVWCVFFRFDVYRFLINPERYQEHFTPQKNFDSAPSRLSLLLGFGISFARARRLRKIWGTLFHVSFPSLRPVISGLMGIFVLFNSKALNSRPYTRSY